MTNTAAAILALCLVSAALALGLEFSANLQSYETLTLIRTALTAPECLPRKDRPYDQLPEECKRLVRKTK